MSLAMAWAEAWGLIVTVLAFIGGIMLVGIIVGALYEKYRKW